MRNKFPEPRRLKSGSWNVQVMVEGVRVSVTANTKAECKAKVYELLNPTPQEPVVRVIYENRPAHKEEKDTRELPTLYDAIDSYVERRENVLSVSTIRGYRMIQKHRFQSVIDTPINKIDWQVVVNQESLLCSSKTIKNAFGLIKAVSKEYNVYVGNIRLPQLIRKELPYLDAEQFQIFYDKIQGDKYELEIMIAMHGLRRSECLSVRREDFENGVIHVRGATVMDENSIFVHKETNKNSKSRRDVIIKFSRMNALICERGKGYIIQCDPETIRKRINTICKENGFPEVGWHGLRRSAASYFVQKGVPEKVIMDEFGWDDIYTMHQRYVNFSKKEKQKMLQEAMVGF